jgi:hypothetical protein
VTGFAAIVVLGANLVTLYMKGTDGLNRRNTIVVAATALAATVMVQADAYVQRAAVHRIMDDVERPIPGVTIDAIESTDGTLEAPATASSRPRDLVCDAVATSKGASSHSCLSLISEQTSRPLCKHRRRRTPRMAVAGQA